MDPVLMQAKQAIVQSVAEVDRSQDELGLGNTGADIDPTKFPLPLPLPDPTTGGTTTGAQLPEPAGLIVKSITVSPATLGLEPGYKQSQGLTASAVFADGSARDVTALVDWSSTAPAIVTVNKDAATGEIFAASGGPNATGKGAIVASLAGVTGKIAVTVSTAAAAKSAISKIPWWGWLAGAAVVVGGVVVVATRKKRKS